MNLDIYKVKLLLAEQGLTQSALSDMCGVSRQNISAVLSKGRCAPVTAGKIAAALGVPVREITKGA